jgi:hypothetical protein
LGAENKNPTAFTQYDHALIDEQPNGSRIELSAP